MLDPSWFQQAFAVLADAYHSGPSSACSGSRLPDLLLLFMIAAFLMPVWKLALPATRNHLVNRIMELAGIIALILISAYSFCLLRSIGGLCKAGFLCKVTREVMGATQGRNSMLVLGVCAVSGYYIFRGYGGGGVRYMWACVRNMAVGCFMLHIAFPKACAP